MNAELSRRLVQWAVLLLPLALVTSRAGAEVYVAQASGSVPPAILVFAPDAIGDTAPIRVITGSNTGMVSPSGLFVDDVNDELYVSDCYAGKVLVFALAAAGNVAPLRTVSSNEIADLHCMRQGVVDTGHDELIVPSFDLGPGGIASTVSVFQRLTNGEVTPLRTLSGQSPSTLINNPTSLIFVAAADELILNSYDAGGSGVPGLLTFLRTASGDVAPLRAIAGPATLFTGYSNSLAYDADHDELYADAYGCGNTCYAAYPRTANGDVAPTRYVSRPDTYDNTIRSLAYDRVYQRLLLVAGDSLNHEPYGVQSVQAYTRTAAGVAPAEAIIAGPHTLIRDPLAIAVDAAGGFSGNGPRSYATTADFDAAVGTPAALTGEDFEDSAVTPGHARVCAEPVNAMSNDACFTPGQIAAGFNLRSSSGKGLGLQGSGFSGNPSDALGALFNGDATVIEFPNGTTAVAFDALIDADADNGGVIVAVYGEGEHALSYARVQPGAGAAAFVGLVSATPMRRMELTSASGGGVALVDNLRFRTTTDTIFVDSFDE